jgi:CDP-glucose 4,6-dehydratase
MITSDKCYENHEWARGYAESDELGGRDVYSGSKAAAEILISSYRRSFANGKMAIASARAGNVIGGGDWSKDRIVPDAITALCDGRAIVVRNPSAVRPWQHVLEPLSGYLTLASRLLSQDAGLRGRASDCWNFGPTIENTRTVGELVTALTERWEAGTWVDQSSPDQPHEAGLLRLDITKAREQLGWAPRWNFDEAIAQTAAWYKAHAAGADMASVCADQIACYEAAQ